jgi:hypothetical protein
MKKFAVIILLSIMLVSIPSIGAIEYRIVYDEYKGNSYDHVSTFETDIKTEALRNGANKLIDRLTVKAKAILINYMGESNYTNMTYYLENYLYTNMGIEPMSIKDPLVSMIAGFFQVLLSICVLLTGENGFTSAYAQALCFIAFVTIGFPVILLQGWRLADLDFIERFGYNPDIGVLFEDWGILIGVPIWLVSNMVYWSVWIIYMCIFTPLYGLGECMGMFKEAFDYAYEVVFHGRIPYNFPLYEISIEAN